MSAPLPATYRQHMRRHVAALRRVGYTWAEVSMLTTLPVPRCKDLGRESDPPFRTVTRVQANGEALVVRVAP